MKERSRDAEASEVRRRTGFLSAAVRVVSACEADAAEGSWRMAGRARVETV